MLNGDRRIPDDFIDRVCNALVSITNNEKISLQHKVKEAQDLYDIKNNRHLDIQKSKMIEYVVYLFKLIQEDNEDTNAIKKIMKEILSEITILSQKYGVKAEDLFNEIQNTVIA